jgi:protein O-mannosyl-transferase
VVQGGLLFCLILIVYLPSLSSGFIWDDDDYVTENSTLHSLGGLKQIWLEPEATPQYYPVVFTTFWVEHHLWGLNPAGYHLVNALLHAANAVGVWLILRRLAVPGA